MNITIERDAFLAALQRVMGAVDRKATIAVLQHVAVRATADTVSLLATNLDMQATTTCAARSDGDHAFTLPGAMAADILNNWPSGAQVELADIEGDPRILFRCGRSRFKLPTLKPQDMPLMEPPEGGVATAPASILANVFDGAAYAASKDAGKFVYTGVFVQASGGRIEAAAADTLRMARAWRSVSGETGTAILPMALVTEMGRLLVGDGPAELVIGPRLAMLRLGSTEIIGKVIDGEYTDYMAAIPKERPYVLTIDRDDLVSAVKRAMIVATEGSRSVRMTFGADCFSVTARSTDTADAEDEIEADWTGGDMYFNVNGTFVLEAIAHLGGDALRLEIATPTRPFVIEEANRMAIVGVQRG